MNSPQACTVKLDFGMQLGRRQKYSITEFYSKIEFIIVVKIHFGPRQMYSKIEFYSRIEYSIIEFLLYNYCLIIRSTSCQVGFIY